LTPVEFEAIMPTQAASAGWPKEPPKPTAVPSDFISGLTLFGIVVHFWVSGRH
jgi:hypothetical protein